MQTGFSHIRACRLAIPSSFWGKLRSKIAIFTVVGVTFIYGYGMIWVINIPKIDEHHEHPNRRLTILVRCEQPGADELMNWSSISQQFLVQVGLSHQQLIQPPWITNGQTCQVIKSSTIINPLERQNNREEQSPVNSGMTTWASNIGQQTREDHVNVLGRS